ncbi:MAG: pyruvate kinase [Candidatus Omnitrophota bacterium]|nr:pyruvate kinase [Candidatus Omnitrophota bacterium]
MVRTKIIATLGPATDRAPVLRAMVRAGLDVVRLNFSHGTLTQHTARLHCVREINKKYRRAIKLMQDLEGYRIRIGRISKEINLKKGAILYLTQKECLGSEKEVSFDYQGSLQGIKRGHHIYIDDGKISLEVVSIEKRRLKTRIITASVLKEHKGVNVPQAHLEFEALTQKDREDAQFAVREKLDCIAQSFVRRARDIELLRSYVRPGHPVCKIIAKIESRESLANIDEIIAASDGIMVARGDMGICFPIYTIPVLQKTIIQKCIRAGKPVIVATQMLESMTTSLLPTRAEVSDVANAIFDGSSAVMLSGETAVGAHPQLVVAMMNKILAYTEAHQKKSKK